MKGRYFARRIRRAQTQHDAPDDGRFVGLVRVSTKDQQLSQGAQADHIRRYVEWKNGSLVRVFEDEGTSGKSPFLDRPVVRDMLALMRREGVRSIAATRMDRYFRSTGDAIHTLDTLYQQGVMLHFCEQNIDPSTPTGRAMFQFLAIFAELETNLRQARQLDAFDEMRKLGQKSGINAPFAWKAVPARDGRLTQERRRASDLVPVLDLQVVLGDMIRRERRGESLGRIAEILNKAKVPTAKAGQKVKWRGQERIVKGVWTERTVASVLDYARLADERFASDDYDEVQKAARELKIK